MSTIIEQSGSGPISGLSNFSVIPEYVSNVDIVIDAVRYGGEQTGYQTIYFRITDGSNLIVDTGVPQNSCPMTINIPGQYLDHSQYSWYFTMPSASRTWTIYWHIDKIYFNSNYKLVKTS